MPKMSLIRSGFYSQTSIETKKLADDLMIKLIENKEMDVVTWLKDQVKLLDLFKKIFIKESFKITSL